ncbi:MAG TPA: GtrA family protein [Casimicrobiaceae bacterium]|jgi:putative flippase GtrA
MREAALEFTRFLIAGAVNTVISYTAYLLLLAILPYLIAYAISYVVGIAISYLLLTRFVFRTQRRLSTAVRFPLVYAVQYLMGSIVLALLVERWGVRASIAAIVAIVASIPVTFLLSRFVLRPKS